MVCLNLAVYLAVALQVAGVEWVNPNVGSDMMNASKYEEQFDPDEISSGWRNSPFSGIPIVGDIFSAFQFLVVNWQFLLDGFPIFLGWISENFLIDTASRTTFAVIQNAVRAVFYILMTMWFIEFISGRIFTD